LKTIFKFSFTLILTFRSQICSLLTLVQRYVYTKLQVLTAFPLLENRRHVTGARADRQTEKQTGGQTDGFQHKIRPSRSAA